jgi:metal transporter CNNM
MAIPLANRYVATRPVVLGLTKLLLLASAQIPLISAAPTLVARNHGHEFDPKPPGDPELWLYLGVAAALVLSGGAFAGLTIALMGQVCSLPLGLGRFGRMD